MIHFEGDQRFNSALDYVSNCLSNAAFLVGCVPDTEVQEANQQKAVWKMRPQFAFIRTTLETTLAIVEHVPNVSTRVRLQSNGIGASSTVLVLLKYQTIESGTQVHWEADISELTGLLKLVPRGLIQSSAQKVIEDTWNQVAAKIQS